MTGQPCPCRNCAAVRAGWFYPSFISPEMRIDYARRHFIEDEPRWADGAWIYPLDWLEREIDEALGLTHARYLTERLRELAA